MSIDDGTLAALKAWRKAQTAERLVMGLGWQGVEHEIVATEPDGTAIHPQGADSAVLHGVCGGWGATDPVARREAQLRDGAAAAGVPVKVLSQRLGHADVTVALKVFAHVMPGDDEAARALVVDALGL